MQIVLCLWCQSALHDWGDLTTVTQHQADLYNTAIVKVQQVWPNVVICGM
jgi:hypothetical protein